jgi:ATP-dependent protease ClpP protease subunit
MEILLYGVVGDPCDGLDAVSLVNAIGQASDDISVRINSLGGLVFDGFAVFNALKQSPKSVTVHIDGIAGSIASIIAMAGDRIIMAENAVMMIHKPSDGTYGVATELRATADRLDMLQSQLVNIYADRTGMTPEELSPLLDAETWMTAQEALAMHFIDEIAGAATATNMLDASKFGFRKVPEHPLIAKATSPAPAATLQNPENIMDPTIDPVTGLPIAAPIVTPPPPTPAITLDQPVNVGDAVAAALTAERSRISTIRNEVSRARLAPTLADTLINDGVSVDAARARIVDAIADGQHTITNIAPASIPAEQFRARADAMSLAIAHRANPRNELTEEARSFAGRRLVVLARDFLGATGVNTSNMGDVEVAQQVFRNRGPMNAGQNTTGDFPSLLANTVGRTLRRSYELAPQTFRSFCRQSSVPDFRPVSRVALSDISAMAQVAQGAEYTYATVGDSAETYTVGKWGQIISLTWETIINDDLSAFDRLPMAMGQEAAQVEGDLVYAILTSNPVMADTIALFHASHANLAGTGTAISIASLTAGRVAMRTQKGPKGRFLNITPATIVVGPLKEGEANQFTSANYVATKNSDINPEYNRNLSVTVDPRITDLSWFLASDPNAQPIDTIEYAYLAGHEGLQTEQRQGFEVDGVDIKARLVIGAKAIDYRGLYKNPGA